MVKQYNQMISDYVRNDGSRQIIVDGEKGKEPFICTVFPIQTSPELFSNANKELTDRLRPEKEMIKDSDSQSLNLEDISDMNNSNRLQTEKNEFSAEIRPNDDKSYKGAANKGLNEYGLDSNKIPIYGLMETMLCDPNKTEGYANNMLTPKISYDAGIIVG